MTTSWSYRPGTLRGNKNSEQSPAHTTEAPTPLWSCSTSPMNSRMRMPLDTGSIRSKTLAHLKPKFYLLGINLIFSTWGKCPSKKSTDSSLKILRSDMFKPLPRLPTKLMKLSRQLPACSSKANRVPNRSQARRIKTPQKEMLNCKQRTNALVTAIEATVAKPDYDHKGVI